MQTMIAFLNAHSTQKDAYNCYLKIFHNEITSNPKFSNEWDAWCLVAYFSQQKDLKTVAPELLLAISLTIVLTPCVFTVPVREIAGTRVVLDKVNLVQSLKNAIKDEIFNLGALGVLQSIYMAGESQSRPTIFSDEELIIYYEKVRSLAKSDQATPLLKFILFRFDFMLPPQKNRLRGRVRNYSGMQQPKDLLRRNLF